MIQIKFEQRHYPHEEKSEHSKHSICHDDDENDSDDGNMFVVMPHAHGMMMMSHLT